MECEVDLMGVKEPCKVRIDISHSRGTVNVDSILTQLTLKCACVSIGDHLPSAEIHRDNGIYIIYKMCRS